MTVQDVRVARTDRHRIFLNGEGKFAPVDEPDPDRETIDHIAVSVDDADAETERMVEETGCVVIDGPLTIDAANAHVSFIEGPDGYVVELVEQLD
ncbi:VOC family protein [Natronococcus pandeyae]|uniref:VOC family protein n=1 Tax=Natronococcus pandeyae TaxID=2055836 RepID=UPI001F1D6867|nr:VOC family protein [Natronococcus pandeyae]